MNQVPRYTEGLPRIVHGLWVAVLVKGSVFVGPVLGRALGGSEEEVMAGGAITWITFAIMALVQLGVLYAFLYRFGRFRPRDIGWSTTRPAIDVAIGVLGFVACASVMLGSMAAFGELDLGDLGAYLGSRTISQQLLFVGIGLLAAFGEESIFRGYLQPTVMQRLGTWGGVVAVAVVFDVMHLHFRPLQLLAKLGIGLVLGGLRGKDRSLYAPGVAHLLIWAVFGMY